MSVSMYEYEYMLWCAYGDQKTRLWCQPPHFILGCLLTQLACLSNYYVALVECTFLICYFHVFIYFVHQVECDFLTQYHIYYSLIHIFV